MQGCDDGSKIDEVGIELAGFDVEHKDEDGNRGKDVRSLMSKVALSKAILSGIHRQLCLLHHAAKER